MHLTAYTDYSLRLLIYLAVGNDRLATIEEIAKSYRISRNHLTKVAHQLGVAGYVETVRGRHGGLRLAKRPETIGLGDVVRYCEPDMAIVMCFDPKNAHCPVLSHCVLRGALSQARRAFSDVLDKYTLADLARPRATLQSLLSIPSTSQARKARLANAPGAR